MPRIVPIQLLTCLKVLLNDNGGILSAGEVKRLASLMTKYSKKLVSKCIYVQILKCTKTELLGEFMGAGGWSLVYTWLNDAIRARNWPLVQEILELLLLCPVDVNRLKINSAPKLVKGLCKDGGNEGVRILAKRLVEQWLKVVTENPEATLAASAAATVSTTAAPTVAAQSAATATMTPQASMVIKTPPVAVVAPIVTPVNTQQTTATIQPNLTPLQNKKTQQQMVTSTSANSKKVEENDKEGGDKEDTQPDEVDEDDECQMVEEQDPLGDVEETTTAPPTSYGLTPAQKKASESGLVYKIVVKNGNQFLAKVPKQSNSQTTTKQDARTSDAEDEENEEDADDEAVAQDTVEDGDKDITDNAIADVEADDSSVSQEKPEKENDSNSGNEEESKPKSKPEEIKKSESRKSSTEDKEKSLVSMKDNKSSKEKERRSSSSGADREKDKEKERDSKTSKSSSSSSSSHRSSSHKSSSSSSKNSSSSSSSKSKSSSSSSHRSSSDKHKSDKDRSSSSSKDKDRNGGSSSSSSSKHRSSSSKSSGSSSSSSKDKHREKDKCGSSSSSSSRNKERDTTLSSDKDKTNTSSASSTEKLSKIHKKTKEENDAESVNKTTSITIPSKKASMSIEIRKDTEKAKTVKTYKSQFRSHGLTEEAPPPPSRKGLKKPTSTSSIGSILPTSLPSSLKRTSPPPRDSPSEKKPKIDINNVTIANEKPGSIKLIPPKKIQTLVETNLFSDALSAATGPKKINKRKRPNTHAAGAAGKDGGATSPPTSPAVEAPKVAPLKFYQDTLDESKMDDSKSDKENDDNSNKISSNDEDTHAAVKHAIDDDDDDDDDDIPLKKVKEDIEQKVAQEKKMDIGDENSNVVDITKDGEDRDTTANVTPDSPNEETASDAANDMPEVKKPGPGCGPNGPPGVLMLHRRKGPKKKLTWRPQDTLEQVRYFELDENERCNVTKTSFMDMKNLERSNERDAVVLARRGFNQEDNMEPTTHWRPLIVVDDVPPHPDGNQSKQRKIQMEREMTTLRALYFTHALIPDSPAEAEIEPIFSHDIPLIPLDDLTGNPDAVNVFTSMPWPEPKGSPKYGEVSSMAGTGGLGSPVDIFGGGPSPQMMSSPRTNNVSAVVAGDSSSGNPFNPFVSPFVGNQGTPNGPAVNVMQNRQQNNWQRGTNVMGGNGSMMGNQFSGNNGSPIMDMMGGGGPRSMGVGQNSGPVHMMNNGPQQNFNGQNFNNQFSPNNNPFGPPMNPFGNGPSCNNFGPMGPGGPMMPPHMMNGMGPGPMMGNNGPSMMNNGPNNNRNNGGGGNWRSGGGPNFQDNNGGGGGGNWRPAGSGPNRGGNGGGGNNNSNNNTGICKAFMRGHCRVGKSCKYIHPSKNKRI